MADAKPTHPLIARFDAIAAAGLDLTAAERLVLLALLRHGDWDTGTGCYPSERTLMTWTGLTRRTVQRALARMTCWAPQRLPDGSRTPCLHCGNADVLLADVKPGSTTSYQLVLARSRQALLPERQQWTADPTVDKSDVPGGDILTSRGDILTEEGRHSDRAEA